MENVYGELYGLLSGAESGVSLYKGKITALSPLEVSIGKQKILDIAINRDIPQDELKTGDTVLIVADIENQSFTAVCRI